MATSTRRGSEPYTDWQTSKDSLGKRVSFMFENPLMSDVQFVVPKYQDEVNKNSEVRIPAHKFLLAISSPVFEAMFYGDMAEKSTAIALPDTDANSLREFLRFLYCDEVRLTFNNVLGVLYLAQKYIVPSLDVLCGEFLEAETNEANVLQILEEAQKFNEPKLEKKCWSFIDSNTSACLESDGVLSISRNTLTSLLKRETVFAREIYLFHAARRWAEAKCNERGLAPTGAAMRDILGDLVHFIRFPTMRLQEFEQNVVPAGILTSEESSEVRQYLSHACPIPVTADFPCAVRAGILSKANMKQCFYLYYDVICPEDEDFTERTESLIFTADKSIHLKGVRLFASKTPGQLFNAEVRLINEHGTELAEAAGTFAVEGCIALGFDVLFKLSVLIRESWRYTVRVTIRGVEGARLKRNLSTPIETIKTVGINFAFEGERAYQIMELFFYTLE